MDIMVLSDPSRLVPSYGVSVKSMVVLVRVLENQRNWCQKRSMMGSFGGYIPVRVTMVRFYSANDTSRVLPLSMKLLPLNSPH